ncbi:unnamed protein product [Echinostoma caproni]|uniref:Death domain-containing protein n=1 Tax=Echinostoma caproni TaxID=27848 RepID=A0A183A5E1_9TREM|nr:unnamed protein product [Echinostoma caproni]
MIAISEEEYDEGTVAQATDCASTLPARIINMCDGARVDSLDTVHCTIQKITSLINLCLDNLESTYIGPDHQDQREYILDAMNHLRRLSMNIPKQDQSPASDTVDVLFGGFVLKSSSEVEALCFEAASAGSHALDIADSLDSVRKLNTHITQFMLHRLRPIFDAVELVVRYAKKYCQSFWNLSTDVQLMIPMQQRKVPVEKMSGRRSSQPVSGKRRRTARKREWNLLQIPTSYEQYRVELVMEFEDCFKKLRNRSLNLRERGVELNDCGPSVQALASQTRSKIHLIQSQHKAFELVTRLHCQQARLKVQIDELRQLLNRMKTRGEQFDQEFKGIELELDKLELLTQTARLRCEKLEADQIRSRQAKSRRLVREARRKQRERAQQNWTNLRELVLIKPKQEEEESDLDPDEQILKDKLPKLNRAPRVDLTRKSTWRPFSTESIQSDISTLSVNLKEIQSWKQRLTELTNVRIPFAQRKKKEVLRRIQWLESKKKQLHILETLFRDREEKQCAKAQNDLKHCESMIQKVDKAILILQHLQSLKASQSIVRNIAHNIELKQVTEVLSASSTTKRFTKKTTTAWDYSETAEAKTLQRALRITARHIGSDWRTLFYNLPFNPSRGNVELEELLRTLCQTMTRANENQLKLAALKLWSKQTKYANPGILSDTLKHIGRISLAERIKRLQKSPGPDTTTYGLGRSDSQDKNAYRLNVPLSAISRAIQRVMGSPRSMENNISGSLPDKISLRPRWIGLPVAITHPCEKACAH